ncbi:MAG: hypothetical protein EKK53_11285 [Burkholderiales bacterium]|nr:MAG: hypothetical protein EKK53_11285 [Burkholderiales bacterium]
MKALVIAVAFAASTSFASAGATRDSRTMDAADKTTATVIADAGRIGTNSLTSLNGNAGPWTPGTRESRSGFDSVTAEIEPGMWLIALAVGAFVVARPLGRALRRQEQHRRAAALASTLGHSQRH